MASPFCRSVESDEMIKYPGGKERWNRPRLSDFGGTR